MAERIRTTNIPPSPENPGVTASVLCRQTTNLKVQSCVMSTFDNKSRQNGGTYIYSRKVFSTVIHSTWHGKITRSQGNVSVGAQAPLCRSIGPMAQSKARLSLSSGTAPQQYQHTAAQGEHMLTLCHATIYLRKNQSKAFHACPRHSVPCRDTYLGSGSCDHAQSLLMSQRVQRSVSLHFPAQSSM